MMSEISRKTHSSEPLPLGLRRPAAGAAARPFVVAHASRSAMPRPASLPRTAGSYLPILVALFALLNAADLVSTLMGLRTGMHEGNPLMSALLAHYGFMALVGYKAVVVGAVALGVRLLRTYRLSIAHATIWICNTLVFVVVVLNVAQYLFQV
jgi:hypothetical protein